MVGTAAISDLLYAMNMPKDLEKKGLIFKWTAK